jgi:hypothetical protein
MLTKWNYFARKISQTVVQNLMGGIKKRVRQYSNLIVSDNSDSLLRDFVKIHAKTLTSIKFAFCSLTSTELKNLLKLVAENIEYLHLCRITLTIDCSVKPVKMPKLKDLKFSVEDEVYGVINYLEIQGSGSHANRGEDIPADEEPQRIINSSMLIILKFLTLDLTYPHFSGEPLTPENSKPL